MSQEELTKPSVDKLFKNQGVYNGLIAVCLLYGLYISKDTELVALFLIFGLQAVFSFIRVITFTNVTENALRDIRNQAFERLVFMPMDFFNQT